MRIRIEADQSAELIATVQAGMKRHAELHVPWETYAEIAVVARDDEETIIGAGLGESGRGWLHVSVIWVDELFRHQNIGFNIALLMEREAIRRGCHSAYLDTFDYQARPFYEKKLGYEVFGTLDDYPSGHQRFFMRKQLSRWQP